MTKIDAQKLIGSASTQGGIHPSASAQTIHLFTAPHDVSEHSYNDGLAKDGLFYYFGQGLYGDQEINSGKNNTLLQHKAKNLSVQLFQVIPNTNPQQVNYVGKFEVDSTRPFIQAIQPDVKGKARSVYIFRLRPIKGESDTTLLNTIVFEGVVTENEIQTSQNDECELPVAGTKTGGPARSKSVRQLREEKEETLVKDFNNHRVKTGQKQLKRNRIKPSGESQFLFTDLSCKDEKILIEAKGSSMRDFVREAIGQLFDYKRFFPEDTQLFILLPSRPTQDLVDLLKSVGINLIYREGDGFNQINV